MNPGLPSRIGPHRLRIVKRYGLLYGITHTGSVWGGGKRSMSKQLALIINYKSRRRSAVESLLTDIKEESWIPASHEKDSFGTNLVTIAKDEECKYRILAQQAYTTLFPLERQAKEQIPTAPPKAPEITGLDKKVLEPVLISPDFFDELAALRTSIGETKAIAQEKEQEIARLTQQLETTQIELENAKDSIAETSEKYSQLVTQEKDRTKSITHKNKEAISAFAQGKIKELDERLIGLLTNIEAVERPSEEPEEKK
ncbi:MAG: hypothetical protein V3T21_05985 [Candidatus Margulisiibacteriota bacterium]